MSRFTDEKINNCIRISNLPIAEDIHVDIHQSINEISPVKLTRTIIVSEKAPFGNIYKFRCHTFVYLWYYQQEYVNNVVNKINNKTYKYRGLQAKLKATLVPPHTRGTGADTSSLIRPNGIAKLLIKYDSGMVKFSRADIIQWPKNWNFYYGETYPSGPSIITSNKNTTSMINAKEKDVISKVDEGKNASNENNIEIEEKREENTHKQKDKISEELIQVDATEKSTKISAKLNWEYELVDDDLDFEVISEGDSDNESTVLTKNEEKLAGEIAIKLKIDQNKTI